MEYKELTIEMLDKFLEEHDKKRERFQFIPLNDAALEEFDKAFKMGVDNYIMKGDLEELGFEDKKQKVSLKVGEEIEHWDTMYCKINQEKGNFWGCTIYTKRSDPKYIRIDGAHAPNAVYGHLGMERWRGHVEDIEDIKKQLKRLRYESHDR